MMLVNVRKLYSSFICSVAVAVYFFVCQAPFTNALIEEDIQSLDQISNLTWLLCSAFLIFFIQTGFALLEAGTVDVKNAKSILLLNVMDPCVSVLGFVVTGYGLAFGRSERCRNSLLASDFENQDGCNPFFGNGNFMLTSVEEEQGDSLVNDYFFFLYQYAFGATAATVVSGCVAERCRFEAYAIYTMVLTAIVYPIAAHWVWSPEGWLSAYNSANFRYLDRLFGVGYGNGFIDYAGSGVVHALGGTAGLVAAWIIGPRIKVAEARERREEHMRRRERERRQRQQLQQQEQEPLFLPPRQSLSHHADVASGSHSLSHSLSHSYSHSYSHRNSNTNNNDNNDNDKDNTNDNDSSNNKCNDNNHRSSREGNHSANHHTRTHPHPAANRTSKATSLGTAGKSGSGGSGNSDSNSGGSSSSYAPVSCTYHGHGPILSSVGVFFLWLGWYGFNPGASPDVRPEASVRMALNTTLTASVAALTSFLCRRYTDRRLDLHAFLNGAIAGLVSGSAGNAFYDPYAAVIVGLVGALVYALAKHIITDRLHIDDPLSASALHGGCGLWGTLAVGLFARADEIARVYGLEEGSVTDYGLFLGGGPNQLLMQLLGCLAITAWSALISLLLFSALHYRLRLLRVTAATERRGLDSDHFGAYIWAYLEVLDEKTREAVESFQFRLV